MREQLHALYALQKIDVKISRDNARLTALDGAREIKKRLLTARAAVEEVEKSLKQQETDLVDLELKLKSVDEKRTKFEKRLYGGSISNPKEISATEKEIGMLKTQQGDLDTQTLTLYDTVDALRTASQDKHKQLEAIEDELRSALGKEAAEKKQLESELAELNAKREAEAAKVTDKALMSRYNAVRGRTGNTGAAKIVDGRCEACRVSVMPFTTRKLTENVEVINCESCGRILMLDFQDE